MATKTRAALTSITGKRQTGFTMIELMIAVAVVAILSAIAIPAYTDYMIRARVSEGLFLIATAKIEVSEIAITTLSAADLTTAANTWNAQSAGTGTTSKYVTSVLITPATGVITVTYNNANIGSIPANATLVLTPYIRAGGAPQQLQAAIMAGTDGSVNWGCASTTNVVATAQGLPTLVAGTLPAEFAPSDCR